jgi:hypothetical protein
MSADSNATIYGRGLNDIVPMAILQQVYNVRKDIHLRYYTGYTKETGHTYLCLSLGRESLSQYPQAAYTGLLVKLAGDPGIDELKKHTEYDFDLHELETEVHPATDIDQLYKNYLPGFILLYKNYRQSGNRRAEKIKEYINKIAGNAGIEEVIMDLLDK